MIGNTVAVLDAALASLHQQLHVVVHDRFCCRTRFAELLALVLAADLGEIESSHFLPAFLHF